MNRCTASGLGGNRFGRFSEKHRRKAFPCRVWARLRDKVRLLLRHTRRPALDMCRMPATHSFSCIVPVMTVCPLCPCLPIPVELTTPPPTTRITTTIGIRKHLESHARNEMKTQSTTLTIQTSCMGVADTTMRVMCVPYTLRIITTPTNRRRRRRTRAQ